MKQKYRIICVAGCITLGVLLLIPQEKTTGKSPAVVSDRKRPAKPSYETFNRNVAPDPVQSNTDAPASNDIPEGVIAVTGVLSLADLLGNSQPVDSTDNSSTGKRVAELSGGGNKRGVSHGTYQGPLPEDSRRALKAEAKVLHEKFGKERLQLEAKARSREIPLSIQDEQGRQVTLGAFDDEDEPVFTTGADASCADTIGADELWPSGSVIVTDIPSGGARFSWPTGTSGLSLTGAGQMIRIWENDGGVFQTHGQLNGRVTQVDSGTDVNFDGLPDFGTDIDGDGIYDFEEDSHATQVAGTAIASGDQAPFSVNTGSTIETWDLGPLLRGAAYGADMRSFHQLDFNAEFNDEAAGDPMNGVPPAVLSNLSLGTVSGFINTGTVASPVWRWYGPSLAGATEDYKFGAYLSSGDFSARQLDIRASTAPNDLMVLATGNAREQGPGGPTTYYIGSSATTSTVTRDWNNGDTGGFDSLPSSACAKNVLSVGAATSLEWNGAGPAVVAPSATSFSSSGPTDDGRIKPEVVACGSRTGSESRNLFGFTGLFSASFDPSNPTADAVSSGSQGTSFASPSATGALALVLQRRNQARPEWYAATNNFPVRSATLRALAVHTATPVQSAGESALPASYAGPDFRHGYGIMNALAATKLMEADALSGDWDPVAVDGDPVDLGAKPFVKEVFMEQNSFVDFNVTAVGNQPIKVTIAWTDPAGAAQTGTTVDPTAKRLVQDLDLRVYPPGVGTFNPDATTNIFKPWILQPDVTLERDTIRNSPATTGNDDTNNVEQVYINAPTTNGVYKVRVTSRNALPVAGQWVSITLSGVQVPAVNFTISNFSQIPGSNPPSWNISFNAVVGGVYYLQGSNNLTTWSNLSAPIIARTENVTTVVTAPPGASAFFWRFARVY